MARGGRGSLSGRFRKRAALVVVAPLFGCGQTTLDEPPPPGDPAATLFFAGARLKPVSLGAPGRPDDEHQLLHWYDTQRDENCQFARAADGEMRCLPKPAFAQYPLRFADSACEVPLVFSLPGEGCEAPREAVAWTPRQQPSADPTCDEPMGHEVYRLEPLGEPPAVAYRTPASR